MRVASSHDTSAERLLVAPSGSSETPILFHAECEPPLDPSRWWVVAVFSMFAMLQCLQWSIPGTIQPALVKLYNIDADACQLMTNCGPLGFLTMALPFSWLMDRHGSRTPVLISVACVFLSALARVFARDASSTSVWLLYASFSFNAIAGPIATAASSKISEDWFPMQDRALATTVMAMANMSCGLILCLLIPLVLSVEDHAHMYRFNLVLLCAASATAAAAFLHWPSQPATAPSASALEVRATSERVSLASLLSSCATLLGQRDYLILFVAFAFLNGFGNVWSTFLPAQLALIGMDENQSAWAALASPVVSTAVALLIARFGDPRRHRRHVIVILAVSAASALGFAALVQGWLPLGAPLASWQALIVPSAAYAGTNLAATAALPLMFEMTVERSFGFAPEASTLMMINVGANIVTSTSLFLPMDSLGALWLSWTMLGTLVFYLVCISVVKVCWARTRQLISLFFLACIDSQIHCMRFVLYVMNAEFSCPPRL